MKLATVTLSFAVGSMLAAAQLRADDKCGSDGVSTMPVIVVSACEKPEDPIEFTSRLLKVLGEERIAKVKARERLAKDARCVEEKLVSTAEEHARLTRDLEVLRCHIQKNCYPFCVSGVRICSRSMAEQLVGTYLIRQETLAAAIAQFESELTAGQLETDQIIAAIDRLECETVLVSHRLTRIVIGELPSESEQMLASLKAMLPKETEEIAAHRVRVAAFLAMPAPGESQTAEGNSKEAAVQCK